MNWFLLIMGVILKLFTVKPTLPNGQKSANYPSQIFGIQ